MIYFFTYVQNVITITRKGPIGSEIKGSYCSTVIRICSLIVGICNMYRVTNYTWPCVSGPCYKVTFPVYGCIDARTLD